MNLPFPRTWWIEPGKIIGGRYPGTTNPAESRQMLDDLLACGVRSIVNLQELDALGDGGKPFPDYRPVLLELAAKRGVSVEVHRFPIRDCDVPTEPVMVKIQQTLQEAVEAGKLTYVHCWGGHGRTGTVAGCWLASQGTAGDLAFQLIKERRVHDSHLAKNAAPQTPAQLSLVKAWPVGQKPVQQDAVRDRAFGALVGLAVGDAVGATLEFEPPGSFEPLTDMIGGGRFGLEAGQWTDDTSMALCLAESLIHRGYFDPIDQLQRYVRWWKQGHHSVKGHCFDIGNQVKAALADHVATGKPFCGPASSRNAGNGSLMRLSPVAIAYLTSPAAAIVYAGESSRTTHQTTECVDACRYFGGLLTGAMRGTGKEELLGAGYCPVPGLWTIEPLAPNIAAIAAGSFKVKQPPAIKGTGYVVDCLEAALWAFHTTDSLEQAVLRAANLGDDADTTAAVCGQIAGAYYGISGIPPKWLEKLAQSETIDQLTNSVFELGKSRQY